MAERISWRKAEFDMKVKELKEKVKDGAKKATSWIVENKELICFIVPTVVGATKIGYNVYKGHREDNIRDRRFYDPRKGRYSTARRKLSNRELREIDERYDLGESYQQILDDMGLLK